MSQPPVNGGARRPALAHYIRLPAWPTLVAGLLIVHSAFILGEQLDLPRWVAFVECLLASLVGLQRLREHTAQAEDPALAASSSAAPGTASTLSAQAMAAGGLAPLSNSVRAESTSAAAGS